MTLSIKNHYYNTPITTYEGERLHLILNDVKEEDLAECIISSIIKEDQVDQLRQYYPTSDITNNHYFTDGNTVLHKAAQYNALKCVKYLVNLFSDINILSKYGSTPLENALINHADDTSSYLRQLGAKAYVTTLSELVAQSQEINNADKRIIQMALEFSEGYCAVVTNIDDYITSLGLAVINDQKDDQWLLTSLELLMSDHIKKLTQFKSFSQQHDDDYIRVVLNKYPLTVQQTIVYQKVNKLIVDVDELIGLCQAMMEIDDIDKLTWQQLEHFKSIVKTHRISRY